MIAIWRFWESSWDIISALFVLKLEFAVYFGHETAHAPRRQELGERVDVS